jgi:hypothetical protein
VLASSNSNAAVSFSTGTKTVFSTVAAEPFGRLFSNVPKVYRALLNQAGTAAPVATVLENTLGSTPAWSREGPGSYRLTLTGAFLSTKTFITTYVVFASGADGRLSRVDNNVLELTVGDGDDYLVDSAVEVLVYP